VLTGCKRALEAGNRRGLCPHQFGELRLREASLLAGFEQGIQKGAFLAFNTLDFGAHTRAAHEFLD
jgi:hypothetical protein